MQTIIQYLECMIYITWSEFAVSIGLGNGLAPNRCQAIT